MTTYKCKGRANFNIVESSEDTNIFEIIFEDSPTDVDTSNSDVFSGLDFLNDVSRLCLTDYDGWVSKVFLNGYLTNIRLVEGGINFYNDKYVNFDADEWKELCDTYKVEVYWVSK